jgi:hypothetical protein
MKKLLLLAALAALALAACAQATPSLQASYSFSDDSPRAGSTVFYYVAVANTGTSTAEDVRVSLMRSESSYANTRGPGSVSLGDIAPGASTVATFAIGLGVYDLGIVRVNSAIFYKYEGRTLEIKQDAYLSVENRQLHISELSSNTKPLQPGSLSRLELTLSNHGSQLAKDFDIDISSAYYGSSPVFRPLGSSTMRFDSSLKEGESMKLDYDLYVDSSVPTGVYDLTLSINYIGGNIDKSETISMGVWISGGAEIELASVSTDPAELREGDEDVKVIISLQNIGQEQVRNLRIDFEPLAPFEFAASSQSSQSLGLLGPSDSVSADFYINVAESALSGTYSMPAVVRYRDGMGQDYEKEINITFRLKRVPLVEVSTIQTEPTTAGESGELLISLKNIGEKDAEGTSIRVFERIEQPFDYDRKSDSVGLIKPGMEGEAILPFKVSGTADAKEYLIEFEIRYTDGNTVYTSLEAVPFTVLPQVQSEFPIWYLAVFIVLSALVLVIWKRRVKTAA